MQDALLYVFGPILLMVVVALFWAGMQEKRVRDLRLAAEEMGFSFKESDPALAAELFAGESGVHLRNVIRGEAQGLEPIVFDLHRTVPSSDTILHVRFTLLTFRDKQATWPGFSLRPRQFRDRLTGITGKGKLVFQNDVTFSRSCVVETDNEEAVSTIFTEEVRRHFAGKRGLWIEAREQVLIITRGQLLDPRKLREFLEEGFTARKVLETGEVDVLQ
jgi:hypothetical protein